MSRGDADTNIEMAAIEGRDRSLPPLRQQQMVIRTNEIRNNELLQQSMIQSIKKRNKHNALMRTNHAGTVGSYKDSIHKSSSHNMMGRTNPEHLDDQKITLNSSNPGTHHSNTPMSHAQTSTQNDAAALTAGAFAKRRSEKSRDNFNVPGGSSHHQQVDSNAFSFENLTQSKTGRVAKNMQRRDLTNQYNFAKKVGPLNQSLQPTQNRKNFNSPYSKNYNEQYYMMA